MKNKAVKAVQKAGKALAKAVKKAVSNASETIACTAKTWKADITQVLIAFAWVHDKTFADVITRLTVTDSAKHVVAKTATILIRGARGSVARDIEISTTGAMRIRNYGAGGTLTGWFQESDVLVAGMTIERFADAAALAKTFSVFRVRKAAGSSESYSCGMDNDLSKSVYSASVRALSNGKLIAWHEEDKRNVYNAHEVSAVEREIAKQTLLGGGKRTVKAKALATATA